VLYVWIGEVVVVNVKRPRKELHITFMDLLECGGMRAHSIDLVIEIGDRKIALIFVFIFESAVKNIVMYGPPEAMHRKPQLQLHRKRPEDSGRLLRKIMEHDGRAEKMTEERGR
jgi:hypothetical protein